MLSSRKARVSRPIASFSKGNRSLRWLPPRAVFSARWQRSCEKLLCPEQALMLFRAFAGMISGSPSAWGS